MSKTKCIGWITNKRDWQGRLGGEREGTQLPVHHRKKRERREERGDEVPVKVMKPTAIAIIKSIRSKHGALIQSIDANSQWPALVDAHTTANI